MTEFDFTPVDIGASNTDCTNPLQPVAIALSLGYLAAALLAARYALFQPPVRGFGDYSNVYRGNMRGCTVDLAPMQKQFARPQGVVVRKIPVRIGRDMRIEQPRFAFTNPDVGFFQLDSAIEHAFHFRPYQGCARLVLRGDVIVMKRRAICGQDLLCRRCCH